MLVPQNAASADRENTDARPAPCDGCGGTQWADLRDESVLDQLHRTDHELLDRPLGLTRPIAAVALFLVAIAIGAALLGGAGMFGSLFVDAYLGEPITKDVAGFAFAGAFAFIMGTYGLVAWIVPTLRRLVRRGRRTPVRWRTLPPSGGEVEAPLTGRRGTGYEVAIRKSDDSQAVPGTWLLVERCGKSPNRRERIDVDSSDPRLGDFLRRRGIDPTGLSLVVYETVLH